MIRSTMQRVQPPMSVEGERENTWHRGDLEAWRRDGEGWRAFVRYSTATGQRHLEWVEAVRVRRN